MTCCVQLLSAHAQHISVILLIMHQNLAKAFTIPPQQPLISEVAPLRKFIEQYPGEELRPNLQALQKNYHHYRVVKGDGNCFYRACLFLYLSLADLKDFFALFPAPREINCRQTPFARDDYQAQFVLRHIWAQYLKPLSNLSRSDRQRSLEKLFRQSFLIDAYLIAYFRTLNQSYLRSKKHEFRDFGDVDSQLERVGTYGMESQGIQILSLAQLLQVRITVVVVLQTTLQEEVYQGGKKHNFLLFFRPGHYDILCNQDDYNRSLTSSSYQRSQFLNENRNDLNQRTASNRVFYNKSNLPNVGRFSGENSTPQPKPMNLKSFNQMTASRIQEQQKKSQVLSLRPSSRIPSVRNSNQSNSRLPTESTGSTILSSTQASTKRIRVVGPSVSVQRKWIEGILLFSVLALMVVMAFK